MLVIAGLGNPGRRYQGTRHNVGFDVVDEIARTLRVTLEATNGDGLSAVVRPDQGDVLLFKPMLSMNNSGEPVARLLEQYGLGPDALLAVYDDFQLPLGALRLRPRGSDGGHNGMASLIEVLGTTDIPRLRCGIGSTSMPIDKSLMADYVLSGFLSEEIPSVSPMVHRAAEACLAVLDIGLVRAMNAFNSSPFDPESAGEDQKE